MFKVELLPAFHGDCIWIEYGEGRSRHRILIDAGPTNTWKGSLRTHLAKRVSAQRHKKMPVELLVLTHIDADHIAGAIPMMQQLSDVAFRDVWFNGSRHLSGDGMLSVKQGEAFSSLIDTRRENWNDHFGGKAVCATEDDLPVIDLEGGMRLTILSPTPKELGGLRRKWPQQLTRHGLRAGAPHATRQFLARVPNLSTDVAKLAATKFEGDGSVPNASSIAFLAEYREGKEERAVLFTGDALASVLTRTIPVLLKKRGLEKLSLDALKVPHHGSRGNINLRLLELLDCRQFWFSSNGDIHKLPDNEAVGRILHSASRDVELVFNYECSRTKVWKRRSLQERHNYTAHYAKGHIEIDLLNDTIRRIDRRK